MFMSCRHRPYCKADGELRIGLPHQHTHLQNVRISGFFGHKEQVELALHILRSSIVLKKMDITPKLEITRIASRDSKYQQHYEDGHRVATEFVCKADHHNVVNVVGVLAQTAMEAWGHHGGEEGCLANNVERMSSARSALKFWRWVRWRHSRPIIFFKAKDLSRMFVEREHPICLTTLATNMKYGLRMLCQIW